jgi:hypothetical protein
MQPNELVARYPRLYHMAEDGSWESIRRHGLLSTKGLLNLFEIKGAERDRLYSTHRPECVTIKHQEYGTAVIRDQKPMDDKGLVRALGGVMHPRQWYELLNDRVFFWLTERRLESLLNARAYRDRSHTVLTVETALLVHRHAHRINLSPINSGCTKPMPHPRGPSTFTPLANYPLDMWIRKRGASNDPVVELAVDYGVPDIPDLTIKVEQRKGTEILQTLWER